MPARRFTIRGTVQGVGFRSFAKTCAEALGVSGWVCNQPDGTVAVHAEGTDEQLAELAFDLSRGPRYARVRAVEPAETAPEDRAGFSILRTEPTR